MDIKDLQKNWNEFGNTDPFWSILTVPNKKGRKWKKDEFFETGRQEINELMKDLKSLNINIKYKKALDFGCGVGRLTQALADYFEQVCGIDIASSMIKLANRYNKFGVKCQYLLNEKDNLELFEDNSFDFVYSNIVLQHMKPEYSTRYIKEFLRILKTGGIAVFQIPSQIKSTDKQDDQIDSPFKAHIIINDISTTMIPDSKITLYTKVKNVSNSIWLISDKIRLGNHWLDSTGNMIIEDDARADLPRNLMPGDEVEVPLTITVPHDLGRYILELDMVKELVTWFNHRGSETVKLNIEVSYPNAIKQSAYLKLIFPIKRTYNTFNALIYHFFYPKIDPIMEMYGIEKSTVIDIVNENRGKIVDIREYYSAGKEWLGLRYCITKL